MSPPHRSLENLVQKVLSNLVGGQKSPTRNNEGMKALWPSVHPSELALTDQEPWAQGKGPVQFPVLT